ncbi:MAG: xanthine dehydrogenase family protein subunit M [Thermodesulfobacteriota bacterium]|nr:xanthine dehydrogenase family protein subunit M [Thermodesulfobacteriota bacterium]
MIPKNFEYFVPSSLDEAISLLEKYGEDAKLMAGGQSLIPLMKLGLGFFEYIISIDRIPNLSYINEIKGCGVAIGGLTNHSMIENSDLIKSKYPLLAEAVSSIGDVQVRNRGTIGGNLCHAEPAADYPPVMVALNAKFKVIGPTGERTIHARDFITDIFTTTLEYNEILTEIILPELPAGTGGAYQRLSRRSGDFAIVSVASLITLDDENNCKDVSITLGAVGSTPIKAELAETMLLEKKLNETILEDISEKVSEFGEPTTDIHASEEYRREMIKVFTKRCLKLALNRTKGEGIK